MARSPLGKPNWRSFIAKPTKGKSHERQLRVHVIHYKEAAPIADPTNPGEMIEGQQQVVVIKTVGDEKEGTHQMPITPDLPGEQELDQWQKDGVLVVISSSSVRAMSFQHVEKDEEGNPKKYPTPGKIYKVGNKNIEIGTMVTFQSYAIRLASADDEARAKEAHGHYLKRQQEARMGSIADRQAKAKERTAKRLQEGKAKRRTA